MTMNLIDQLTAYGSDEQLHRDDLTTAEVLSRSAAVRPIPSPAPRSRTGAWPVAILAATVVVLVIAIPLLLSRSEEVIPPATTPSTVATTVAPNATPTTPPTTVSAPEATPGAALVVEGFSPPGEPWQPVVGAEVLDARGVVDGRYYFGEHGEVSHVSDDGVTFESDPLLGPPPGVTFGEWGIDGGLFWAQADGGSDQQVAMRSEDGITWDWVTTPAGVRFDLYHAIDVVVRTDQLLAVPATRTTNPAEQAFANVVLTSKDNGLTFVESRPFDADGNASGFLLGSTGTELFAIHAAGPKELEIAYSTDGVTWTTATTPYDLGLDGDFETTRLSEWDREGPHPPHFRKFTGDDRSLFTVASSDGVQIVRYTRAPGRDPELSVLATLSDRYGSIANIHAHAWSGTIAVFLSPFNIDLDGTVYVTQDFTNWTRTTDVDRNAHFLNDRIYEYNIQTPRQPANTTEINSLIAR